jgi:hypothetical protein
MGVSGIQPDQPSNRQSDSHTSTHKKIRSANHGDDDKPQTSVLRTVSGVHFIIARFR